MPPHPNAPYQQAPTPNAYPPSMPPGVQAPPYAGGGYPLPQPSASGNFDLSTIKPVNSGTVSIADAIAQAKAFATEKGISYEHSRAPSASYQSHDPRAHYRSRSRSPPARREAYRDNLNPYRDERRDEHRGNSREYGRDRSMSPGHSRGHFSPRGNNSRDRGSGGGGDEDTETIQIESSLVGLIIGRQGENLRRVESETGCRVQFITGPDNQGPYRQCRISGPQARRAEAKTAIDRIIEDSGMGAIARAGLDKGRGGGAAAAHAPVPGTLREGEDCMQIMVPDRTVGLIIGRGGETIRDLQERSGCHINIVGENKSVNGLRPVNLIGSREAAAQAKEHIMEIVDSDSRNVNGGGKQDRPPRNDHGRDSGPPSMGGGMGGGMGMGGGAGGGDKINDSIYVPSEAVGMIIGKGGETIREMQSQTGCKINVSQSSGPGEVEREIGLVGSRDAISRAKLAIEDKVEAVRQKNSGGGGRGGGRPPRRDYDNPNYSQSGSNNAAGPSGGAAAAGQPPAAAGGADPYAAYGGYQAYLALWYQALAQQQQNGQGEAPKQ
ncbi:hypothetical protein PG991_012518 [Apiospora marii]|uniref:K Homology domain-containing protein n=1 Tax=Apiospora marii TaxID=335849 RepID=A0ABR1RAV3_9PEZI